MQTTTLISAIITTMLTGRVVEKKKDQTIGKKLRTETNPDFKARAMSVASKNSQKKMNEGLSPSI